MFFGMNVYKMVITGLEIMFKTGYKTLRKLSSLVVFNELKVFELDWGQSKSMLFKHTNKQNMLKKWHIHINNSKLLISVLCQITTAIRAGTKKDNYLQIREKNNNADWVPKGTRYYFRFPLERVVRTSKVYTLLIAVTRYWLTIVVQEQMPKRTHSVVS